jgi:hypothetical protein
MVQVSISRTKVKTTNFEPARTPTGAELAEISRELCSYCLMHVNLVSGDAGIRWATLYARARPDYDDISSLDEFEEINFLFTITHNVRRPYVLSIYVVGLPRRRL